MVLFSRPANTSFYSPTSSFWIQKHIHRPFSGYDLFCHFTVHHEVRRHQNEISQQLAAEARLKILLNRKSLQLTATVALVLFLCYTPLFLYRFILVLHRNNTSPEDMYASILISPSFAISNSLFNPFIHVARLKEFRIAFIELLSGTAT